MMNVQTLTTVQRVLLSLTTPMSTRRLPSTFTRHRCSVTSRETPTSERS